MAHGYSTLEVIRLKSDSVMANCDETRGVEAEAEAGSGSGPFSVEAEARKIHRFRFHIGGKNGGRKKIGSAILRRRTNRGSINTKT